MTFIPEPHKIKLELMSNEIENLIEELSRVPKNLYDFFNYDLLIVKLKQSLDNSSTKECNCGGIKGKDWSHEEWCNSSTKENNNLKIVKEKTA